MCFHVRMFSDLPYTVFETGMQDGFTGTFNRIGCFSELYFLNFFVAQVLVWLQKQYVNNFIFPSLAYAAGFNNNNNNIVFKLSASLAMVIIRAICYDERVC